MYVQAIETAYFLQRHVFPNLFVEEVYDIFRSDLDAGIFQLRNELIYLQRLTQK